MNPLLRKFLFRFLAIFFIINVPILVFLVLGYDLDLQSKKVVNMLEVSVETRPAGAKITNFGKDLNLTTPTNLKVNAGNTLDLEIARDGFLSERFGIYGPTGYNSNFQISNLWLLPEKSQTITALNNPKNHATGQKIKENIEILPEIILWTETSQGSSQEKFPNNSTPNNSQNSAQNSNNSVSETSVSVVNNLANSSNQKETENQILAPNLVSNSTSSSNLENSGQNSSQNSVEKKVENGNKIEQNSSESSVSLDNNSNSDVESVMVQTFSLNGLSGLAQRVEKKSPRSIKNLDKNERKWQNIGVNSFWDQQNSWLLFEVDQKWYLEDLANFKINQIVRKSTWQFLILQNKTLWLWDKEKPSENILNLLTNPFSVFNNSQNSNSSEKTPGNSSQNSLQKEALNQTQNSILTNNSGISSDSNSISSSDQNSNPISSNFSTNSSINSENRSGENIGWYFLESDVDRISTDERTIWLWQKSQLYRLETGKIENWKLSAFAKTTVNSTGKNLKVKSFLQGNLFLFGSELWFLPDQDRTAWLIISNNVASFENFEEMVFWQDEQGFLQSYNFITKSQKLLGKVGMDNSKNEISKNELFYDQSMRRLMIYDQNGEIWTVWFDKFSPNSTNIIYYPQKWLQNPKCVPRIQERLQFCLENDNLITFGNFRLF